MYTIFAFLCCIFGIAFGLFLIYKSLGHRDDNVLFWDLFVLGVVNLFAGSVYFYGLLNHDFIVISSTLTISTFMRPVNMLLLLIPSLIVLRVQL